MFRQMSSKKPEKVAMALADIPYGTRLHSDCTLYLANNWSKKDPKAALEWAQSIESSKAKQNAFDAIFRGFAQYSTDEAKAYLFQLEDKRQRKQLASSISKTS